MTLAKAREPEKSKIVALKLSPIGICKIRIFTDENLRIFLTKHFKT